MSAPYPVDLYAGCPCLACQNRWQPLGPGERQYLFMTLCPACGNKRCPAASDHTAWKCSGSNETGQAGERLPVGDPKGWRNDLDGPYPGPDRVAKVRRYRRWFALGVIIWVCIFMVLLVAALLMVWPNKADAAPDREALAKGYDLAIQKAEMLVRTPPGVIMSEHTEGIVHAIKFMRQHRTALLADGSTAEPDAALRQRIEALCDQWQSGERADVYNGYLHQLRAALAGGGSE